MGEVFGACKQREELWQRWMDACGEMAGAEEENVRGLRLAEQSVRNLLNHHMMRHRCGLLVSEPKARETMIQMFANNSGMNDSSIEPPTRPLMLR